MKNKKKKSKLKWLFIFSPIIVIVIAVGVVYGVVESKLGPDENNPKKELVNSLVKDSLLNPTEINDTIDSITITDQSTAKAEGGASTGTTEQSSPAITKTAAIKEIKDNYSNYDLVSSIAENVGGSNYHITATVKDKTTGEIKNIEVTTKLSENTKKLLKNYVNSK